MYKCSFNTVLDTKPRMFGISQITQITCALCTCLSTILDNIAKTEIGR